MNTSGRLNTTLLENLSNDIVGFINTGILPVLVAIAFIIFIWGVFKYFIYGAGNEEDRRTGRQFIMYGIIGFFVIFSVWGLVFVLVDFFNLSGPRDPGQLLIPEL